MSAYKDKTKKQLSFQELPKKSKRNYGRARLGQRKSRFQYQMQNYVRRNASYNK